ncbi:MAG: DUF3299 domain-containing protein [Deltaproteobacteria bacterium]|jgi:hypothetical protein|nr:DUF3299 domain-containing protein [Deltaproteobacteria bacterium]
MISYARVLLSFAICCILGYVAPSDGKAAAASYREAQWEELVPQSWHPELAFEGLDWENLSDDDPRVEKAFELFMAEWAKAPVNEQVDGQRIKIPGFVAPLDWENDAALKEFLLVPYFGACIHSPPPPANQIIYIRLEKPLKGIRSMDAIWAYGVILLEKNDSGSMGASGYSMRLDKVELYK